jgi:molecular chaperone HscB
MDPFRILGVEKRFDLDLAVLEKTHRELSRALHPDRFTGAGSAERRDALEKAASVNEAWRALRDPVKRAEALFVSLGVPVGDASEPKPSPAFLMEMLDEREALQGAREQKDLPRVEALGEKVRARMEKAEDELAAGFRRDGMTADDVRGLLPRLGELRFYRRFLEEVSAIEDEALE